MNDRTRQASVVGVGFLLLAAIVYGVFLFAENFLKFLQSSDRQLAAAIIAAIGAVVTLFISQHLAKSREIRESHRPQKIAVYNRFMDKIVEFLKKSKEGKLDLTKGDLSNDMADFVYSFTKDLIIWGSPGVIKAFEQFRKVAGSDPGPHTMLFVVDDLLREFRKDLGNSNFGLSKGELVKLFLKDTEELKR